MSDSKRNKIAISCCGCAGVGCVGIIIAILVGGYFGASFVAEKGRSFAAFAFKRTMEISLRDAFSKNEQKEIMKKATKLAKDIESGKVGLIDLATKVSAQLSESTLFAQTMALSFKRHYFMAAEDGVKDDAKAKKIKLISQFVYGLASNKLSTDKAKQFLELVTVQYKEKFDPKSDSNMTHTGKKINYNLSAEKVKNILSYLTKICGNIKVPNDYNPSDAAKNEYLKIFKSMYEETKAK